MIKLKYLNLLVNWILTSFGTIKFSGSLVSSIATFKDTGKNIASDFDLVVLFPSCMVCPKHIKCLYKMLITLCNSHLL